MDYKFVFYDYECFSNDWLGVFISEDAAERGRLVKTVIVNDFDSMRRYFDVHKDWIWIGYNSNHYDQWIAKAILNGIAPFKMNEWIIAEGQEGWKYPEFGYGDIKRFKLKTWDCYNRVTDGGG